MSRGWERASPGPRLRFPHEACQAVLHDDAGPCPGALTDELIRSPRASAPGFSLCGGARPSHPDRRGTRYV